MHRVRDFGDKIGTIYIENSVAFKPDTASKVTSIAQDTYGFVDLSEVG